MGLDASVMCRCLADGKVALPKFAKSVHIDEEGYLHLDAPDEKGALHMRFHQWMSDACIHPRMLLSREHISNWTGYRSFQQALGIAGWQHFPTLEAELPSSNGGLTATGAAAEMLNELDYFDNDANLGWTTVLVDSATGKHLHEYIETYGGVFSYGADGITLGVDELGFFIRNNDELVPTEFFRSMRFSQKLLHASTTASSTGPAIELVDLQSGKNFRCNHAVTSWIAWPDGRLQNDDGHMNVIMPAELHVIPHQRKTTEYEYIVGQLRKVSSASVETGNPIRWS